MFPIFIMLKLILCSLDHMAIMGGDETLACNQTASFNKSKSFQTRPSEQGPCDWNSETLTV